MNVSESLPLLSGWWRRVGAVVVDLLVVAVPIALLAVITHGYHVTHSPRTGRLVFHRSTTFSAASAAIAILYQVGTLCRTGRHNGQTLGDQLLGVSVVRDAGGSFGLGTYVLRQLACQSLPQHLAPLVPAGFVLLLLLALDCLWPLWDPENRALHDIVARTHVLRVPERRPAVVAA